MATITSRKKKDGSTVYGVQVRIVRAGVMVHQETASFPKRKLAEQWGREREAKLRAPGGLEAERESRQKITFGELVERYIAEIDGQGGKSFGRVKRFEMERLLNWPIASRDALDLSSEDYAEHVRLRRESGVSAATVTNDLTWIKQVIDVARTMWGVKIDPQALEDAKKQMRRLGWDKKSKCRTRRPTADELERILAFYRSAEERMLLPMHEIVQFAVSSCRRVDEITRLRWDDLDEEKRVCTVRDVKHPTDKRGNHLVFRVTPEAMEIISRQPRTDERIFPYNSRSVSGSFWRTCKLLGIKDLRFHDLRREAVSRLFEKGYAIHEVAMFSLHQSWQSLKIYTQLRPEDLIDR